MNFENIFILPNVIEDKSRRRFEGIFIKIPKVTCARSSLEQSVYQRTPGPPCGRRILHQGHPVSHLLPLAVSRARPVTGVLCFAEWHNCIVTILILKQGM